MRCSGSVGLLMAVAALQFTADLAAACGRSKYQAQAKRTMSMDQMLMEAMEPASQMETEMGDLGGMSPDQVMDMLSGMEEAERERMLDQMVTVELDIHTSVRDWLDMSGSRNANMRPKRDAGFGETRLWRRPDHPALDRHITYITFWEEDDAELRTLLYWAFDVWEDATCLKFRPLREDDDFDTLRSWVEVTNDEIGCFSWIGRYEDGQQLNLNKTTCKYPDIILHEVGHTIGLWHEHTRYDRDGYLKVHIENVQENFKDQFMQINRNLYDPRSVQYDYLSLMHYGKHYFAKRKCLVTLEPTDSDYLDKIGMQTLLSFRDIKKVNTMYQCNDDCDQAAMPNCAMSHPEAFVGKDCMCWCPGPNMVGYMHCGAD